MHPAIFVLSTGRCGTQWLAHALAAVYADQATVTHEPVRGPYAPRRYLRAGDRLDELLAVHEISAHLSFIRTTLASRTYVETGWPCYPALPLFVEQLEGAVRIVHLVRHPVPIALSLTTHRVYDSREDWVAGAAITPHDPGVIQKELGSQWESMTAYEKCLFWWTEINLYALELQKRLPGVDFLLVRYEDLFGGGAQSLERLTTFMGLPNRSSLAPMREQYVDRYVSKSQPVDWKLIFRYPRTMELAAQFGYDFETLSAPRIVRRYFDVGRARRLWQRIFRRRFVR